MQLQLLIHEQEAEGKCIVVKEGYFQSSLVIISDDLVKDPSVEVREEICITWFCFCSSSVPFLREKKRQHLGGKGFVSEKLLMLFITSFLQMPCLLHGPSIFMMCPKKKWNALKCQVAVVSFESLKCKE